MATFLASIYLWIKAVHLIAVIAWMAGMMYLPRLFVYQHQSEKGGEAEKYFIQMQRRLLKGIINPAILSAGWFHVKLALVVAISAVHGFYASSRRKFEKGERPRTQKFWRIMNEMPFLALIVIVILVIVKPF